jgi:hypothetical protein
MQHGTCENSNRLSLIVSVQLQWARHRYELHRQARELQPQLVSETLNAEHFSGVMPRGHQRDLQFLREIAGAFRELAG